MSESLERQNTTPAPGDFASLQGRGIMRANSSLKNLSIEFEGGVGLSLDAIEDEGDIEVKATVLRAEELLFAGDAICSVDWTWIYGSSVTSIKASSQVIRLELSKVGPLTISVNLWQGSPFLSFQPFRAPR